MKKYIIIFVLPLLFSGNNLYSQSVPTDKELKKTTYIFEGKVLGIQTFKVNDKQFVSYKIHIIKILNEEKDLLAGDTVEIVSILPESWGVLNTGEFYHRNQEHAKPLSKQKGLASWISAHGVFFTEKNTSITSGLHFFKTSLIPKFESSDAFYAYIPKAIYNKELNRIDTTYSVRGFNSTFSDIDSFNDYLLNLKLKSSSLQQVADKKKRGVFSRKSRMK